MSDAMKSCMRCKTEQPEVNFRGYKLCPSCRKAQKAIGLAQAKANKEKKKMAKEADAAYLKQSKDEDQGGDTPPAIVNAAPVVLTENKPRGHKHRTPMSARRILDYAHKEPGKVYYSAHNSPSDPDRLEMMEEAGWQFVINKNKNALSENAVDTGRIPGSAVSKLVGGGLTDYLMWKPADEEKADLDAHVEAKARKIEEAILGHGQEENPNFFTRKDMPTRVETLHGRQVKPG